MQLQLAPFADTTWYRLWWILWAVAFIALAMIAARIWLVNPILRGQQKIVEAVERQHIKR